MNEGGAPPCALCAGTGFIVVEEAGASRARPCLCRRPSARPPDPQACLESARVPRRYRECDFQNFADHGPHALTLAGARSVAMRYAEEYPLNDRGLMFMGPPGVGKTHLAVATLRRLMLDKGVPCLFCDVPDLLRRIQGTFDRQSGTTQSDLLQPVLQTEVVLLDDLGSPRLSPWVEETLAHIVTTRYNDTRATLVTTNYLDDPRREDADTLEDRIGPRVRSRLHEMCHLVLVPASDFRREVGAADHHPIPDPPARARRGA